MKNSKNAKSDKKKEDVSSKNPLLESGGKTMKLLPGFSLDELSFLLYAKEELDKSNVQIDGLVYFANETLVIIKDNEGNPTAKTDAFDDGECTRLDKKKQEIKDAVNKLNKVRNWLTSPLGEIKKNPRKFLDKNYEENWREKHDAFSERMKGIESRIDELESNIS